MTLKVAGREIENGKMPIWLGTWDFELCDSRFERLRLARARARSQRSRTPLRTKVG